MNVLSPLDLTRILESSVKLVSMTTTGGLPYYVNVVRGESTHPCSLSLGGSCKFKLRLGNLPSDSGSKVF